MRASGEGGVLPESVTLYEGTGDRQRRKDNAEAQRCQRSAEKAWGVEIEVKWGAAMLTPLRGGCSCGEASGRSMLPGARVLIGRRG